MFSTLRRYRNGFKWRRIRAPLQQNVSEPLKYVYTRVSLSGMDSGGEGFHTCWIVEAFFLLLLLLFPPPPPPPSSYNIKYLSNFDFNHDVTFFFTDISSRCKYLIRTCEIMSGTTRTLNATDNGSVIFSLFVQGAP